MSTTTSISSTSMGALVRRILLASAMIAGGASCGADRKAPQPDPGTAGAGYEPYAVPSRTAEAAPPIVDPVDPNGPSGPTQPGEAGDQAIPMQGNTPGTPTPPKAPGGDEGSNRGGAGSPKPAPVARDAGVGSGGGSGGVSDGGAPGGNPRDGGLRSY